MRCKETITNGHDSEEHYNPEPVAYLKYVSNDVATRCTIKTTEPCRLNVVRGRGYADVYCQTCDTTYVVNTAGIEE